MISKKSLGLLCLSLLSITTLSVSHAALITSSTSSLSIESTDSVYTKYANLRPIVAGKLTEIAHKKGMTPEQLLTTISTVLTKKALSEPSNKTYVSLALLAESSLTHSIDSNNINANLDNNIVVNQPSNDSGEITDTDTSTDNTTQTPSNNQGGIIIDLTKGEYEGEILNGKMATIFTAFENDESIYISAIGNELGSAGGDGTVTFITESSTLRGSDAGEVKITEKHLRIKDMIEINKNFFDGINQRHYGPIIRSLQFNINYLMREKGYDLNKATSSVLSEFDTIKNRTNGIISGKSSDEEKIAAIRYEIQNVIHQGLGDFQYTPTGFDFGSPALQQGIEFFHTGEAVCAGMTDLYSIMLSYANIDMNISFEQGKTAKEGRPHILVKLNGNQSDITVFNSHYEDIYATKEMAKPSSILSFE